MSEESRALVALAGNADELAHEFDRLVSVLGIKSYQSGRLALGHERAKCPTDISLCECLIAKAWRKLIEDRWEKDQALRRMFNDAVGIDQIYS